MMASYPSKHLKDTILDLLLRWKVESLLKPGLKGRALDFSKLVPTFTDDISIQRPPLAVPPFANALSPTMESLPWVHWTGSF